MRGALTFDVGVVGHPNTKLTYLTLHKTAPPTAPKVAWVDGGYVDKKSADVGMNHKFQPGIPVPDDVARTWRHGYVGALVSSCI